MTIDTQPFRVRWRRWFWLLAGIPACSSPSYELIPTEWQLPTRPDNPSAITVFRLEVLGKAPQPAANLGVQIRQARWGLGETQMPPALTANDDGLYRVRASTSEEMAYLAYDEVSSTWWPTGTQGFPHWVALEIDEPVAPPVSVEVSLHQADLRSPSGLAFLIWLDDAWWVAGRDLQTEVWAGQNEQRTFELWPRAEWIHL